MVGIYPSPLTTLAAFALTFSAGAIAVAVAVAAWQWHGRRMREAGRRDMQSTATV